MDVRLFFRNSLIVFSCLWLSIPVMATLRENNSENLFKIIRGAKKKLKQLKNEEFERTVNYIEGKESEEPLELRDRIQFSQYVFEDLKEIEKLIKKGAIPNLEEDSIGENDSHSSFENLFPHLDKGFIGYLLLSSLVSPITAKITDTPKMLQVNKSNTVGNLLYTPNTLSNFFNAYRLPEEKSFVTKNFFKKLSEKEDTDFNIIRSLSNKDIVKHLNEAMENSEITNEYLKDQLTDLYQSELEMEKTFQKIYKEFRIEGKLLEMMKGRVNPQATLERINALEKHNKMGTSIISQWPSIELPYRKVEVDESIRKWVVPEGYFDTALKGTLYTVNISNCVGMTVWSEDENNNKNGGLFHINLGNIKSVFDFFENRTQKNDLDDFLAKVAGGTHRISKLKVTLVGGYSPHINFVLEYLKLLKIKNVKIMYNAKWGSYNSIQRAGVGFNIDTGKTFLIENERKLAFFVFKSSRSFLH